MTTAVQKAEQKSPVVAMRETLEGLIPKMQEIAPYHMNAERMVRIFMVQGQRTPLLFSCTQSSVMAACMLCSQMGLEPIGAGGVHLLPFKRKIKGDDGQFREVYEATVIVDWRGMVNCAKYAGVIKDAYAAVVYTNDEFDYELGDNPHIKHKPTLKDRGEKLCAYCVVVMPDGSKRPEVMNQSDIEAIRGRSKAWQNYLRYKTECPWNTDEDAMWTKTVVRRAMKPFIGANPRLTAAIEADDRQTAIQFQPDREAVRMPREIGVDIEPEMPAEAKESAVVDVSALSKKQKEMYDKTHEAALADGYDKSDAAGIAFEAAGHVKE
jgi:recombination protein RecT